MCEQDLALTLPTVCPQREQNGPGAAAASRETSELQGPSWQPFGPEQGTSWGRVGEVYLDCPPEEIDFRLPLSPHYLLLYSLRATAVYMGSLQGTAQVTACPCPSLWLAKWGRGIVPTFRDKNIKCLAWGLAQSEAGRTQ